MRCHCWPVLFGHKVSVTVSFVPLQNFNNSRFSPSVSFVQLRGLSPDCFILLRDFNDGRFCSVNDAGFKPSCDLGDSSFFSITRFQRQ